MKPYSARLAKQLGRHFILQKGKSPLQCIEFMPGMAENETKTNRPYINPCRTKLMTSQKLTNCGVAVIISLLRRT